jgi:hypothetical protein
MTPEQGRAYRARVAAGIGPSKAAAAARVRLARDAETKQIMTATLRKTLQRFGVEEGERAVGDQLRADVAAKAADTPYVLTDAPGEPVRATLRRMADVLVGHKPEPSVGDAFDGVVQLPSEEAPLWPRNPVPSGEPQRRLHRTERGRPAGAADLTPLFATGLVLLLGWTLGEPYAPTQAEADAIAVPLSNVLARRIDLAAKMGRDASDVIALAVAVMAYLYRVGPLAAERVRSSLDDRRQRERAYPAGPSPSDYDDGAGRVALGASNGAGTELGSTYHPLDAVAKATSLGRDILSRDLRPPSDGGTAVGADG